MIVVAVDSFKGSISSIDAGNAIKQGLKKHGFVVKVFPVADGGEGTLEVFEYSLKPKKFYLDVCSPIQNLKIKAPVLIKVSDGFVELAKASGLELLKKSERNPLFTTT
ncbi:MAG: glycerate kinase, partial [bacterium]|nr:glycerate kinase [bacterium]